jgi:NTE family protein
MTAKDFPKGPHIERVALVLQGGGALGAYQVGVFEALAEHGFAPDWVAGTSIGAVNGAIIAGNRPKDRMARLEQFWRGISRQGCGVNGLTPELRQCYSFWSALQAFMSGQPDFFTSRWPPPLIAPGDACSASFYDTSPLRSLLQHLVDFEFLNEKAAVRFSVGAVHVTSGRLRYFDNKLQPIHVEHVMASGALPPGFPAVKVDDQPFWDGGVYSNTPLEVVLDDYPRVNTLCFMVDLFNAEGREPRTIDEVMTRYKDIQYATRSREHIETYARMHNLRRTVRALYKRLPEEVRNDPEVQQMAAMGCRTTMDIVHLSYRDAPWELSTKDADFSWAAIEERWALGYRDATRACAAAPWLEPAPPHVGVVVHELPPATASS